MGYGTLLLQLYTGSQRELSSSEIFPTQFYYRRKISLPENPKFHF